MADRAFTGHIFRVASKKSCQGSAHTPCRAPALGATSLHILPRFCILWCKWIERGTTVCCPSHCICCFCCWCLVQRLFGAAGWDTRDRIAGPLSLVQQESDSTMVLQHSLELNSARALSLNSCHQEAVDKFGALEASGKGSCIF